MYDSITHSQDTSDDPRARNRQPMINDPNGMHHRSFPPTFPRADRPPRGYVGTLDPVFRSMSESDPRLGPGVHAGSDPRYGQSRSLLPIRQTAQNDAQRVYPVQSARPTHNSSQSPYNTQSRPYAGVDPRYDDASAARVPHYDPRHQHPDTGVSHRIDPSGLYGGHTQSSRDSTPLYGQSVHQPPKSLNTGPLNHRIGLPNHDTILPNHDTSLQNHDTGPPNHDTAQPNHDTTESTGKSELSDLRSLNDRLTLEKKELATRLANLSANSKTSRSVEANLKRAQKANADYARVNKQMKTELFKMKALVTRYKITFPDAQEKWDREFADERSFWDLLHNDGDFWALLQSRFVSHTSDGDDAKTRKLSKRDIEFLECLLALKRSNKTIKKCDAFHQFWKLYLGFEYLVRVLPVKDAWSNPFGQVITGFLSESQATELLSTYPPGTAVIRFSTSRIGELVISGRISDPEKGALTVHTRVSVEGSRLVVHHGAAGKSKAFSGIREMLDRNDAYSSIVQPDGSNMSVADLFSARQTTPSHRDSPVFGSDILKNKTDAAKSEVAHESPDNRPSTIVTDMASRKSSEGTQPKYPEPEPQFSPIVRQSPTHTLHKHPEKDVQKSQLSLDQPQVNGSQSPQKDSAMNLQHHKSPRLVTKLPPITEFASFSDSQASPDAKNVEITNGLLSNSPDRSPTASMSPVISQSDVDMSPVIMDHQSQTEESSGPVGHGQPTQVCNSQQTPVGNGQQTPMGNGQQTPVDNGQQTPVVDHPIAVEHGQPEAVGHVSQSPEGHDSESPERYGNKSQVVREQNISVMFDQQTPGNYDKDSSLNHDQYTSVFNSEKSQVIPERQTPVRRQQQTPVDRELQTPVDRELHAPAQDLSDSEHDDLLKRAADILSSPAPSPKRQKLDHVPTVVFEMAGDDFPGVSSRGASREDGEIF
eukprot:881916_1